MVNSLDTEKRLLSDKQDSDSDTPALYLRQLFPPTDDHGYSGKFASIGKRLVVTRAGGQTNRLVVMDQGVSRQHFMLEPVADGIFLRDRSSTNGTFVGGKQVKEVVIQPQEVIRICDTMLMVTTDRPRRIPELQRYGLVATGDTMLEAAERVKRVADTKRRVLLLGETGTGKDLLAEYLHECSGRSGKMVSVNCATIRESLMESTLFGAKEGAYTGAVERPGLVQKAHRGTLFLDEIGELPDSMQAAILRFLETGEALPVGALNPDNVDVRLTAATNRITVEGGLEVQLRADLLARLEDEVFYLPPLRERREDIVPLIFLAIRKAKLRPADVLNPEFVEEALCYSWPRNIRQLLKVVESCLLHLKKGRRLSPDDLRERLTETTPGQKTEVVSKDSPSAAELKTLLEEHGHNIAAVARNLSVHRQQVYRWLKRHDLVPEK